MNDTQSDLDCQPTPDRRPDGDSPANSNLFDLRDLSTPQRAILARLWAAYAEDQPRQFIELDRSEVASAKGLEARGLIRTHRPRRYSTSLLKRKPIPGSKRRACLTSEGIVVLWDDAKRPRPIIDPAVQRQPLSVEDLRGDARALAVHLLAMIPPERSREWGLQSVVNRARALLERIDEGGVS